jgi:hypothetical protein
MPNIGPQEKKGKSLSNWGARDDPSHSSLALSISDSYIPNVFSVALSLEGEHDLGGKPSRQPMSAKSHFLELFQSANQNIRIARFAAVLCNTC